jgi:hypothetical protein
MMMMMMNERFLLISSSENDTRELLDILSTHTFQNGSLLRIRDGREADQTGVLEIPGSPYTTRKLEWIAFVLASTNTRSALFWYEVGRGVFPISNPIGNQLTESLRQLASLSSNGELIKLSYQISNCRCFAEHIDDIAIRAAVKVSLRRLEMLNGLVVKNHHQSEACQRFPSNSIGDKDMLLLTGARHTVSRLEAFYADMPTAYHPVIERILEYYRYARDSSENDVRINNFPLAIKWLASHFVNCARLYTSGGDYTAAFLCWFRSLECFCDATLIADEKARFRTNDNRLEFRFTSENNRRWRLVNGFSQKWNEISTSHLRQTFDEQFLSEFEKIISVRNKLFLAHSTIKIEQGYLSTVEEKVLNIQEHLDQQYAQGTSSWTDLCRLGTTAMTIDVIQSVVSDILHELGIRLD